jgi:hypothetical protein
MKKTFLVVAMILSSCLLVDTSSAQAQRAVGLSVVGYDQDARVAGGLSGTYVDYALYQFYDPFVYGLFFFRDNPESPIAEGGGYGVNSSVIIGGYEFIGFTVSFNTNDYRPNKTYCTFSDHRLVAYHWYYIGSVLHWFDPHRISLFLPTTGGNQSNWYGYPFAYYYVIPRLYPLGSTEVCITTPPDTCGTISENGQVVPCPSPTPTPTPTPTPPTLNVTEVGFANDYLVIRLEDNDQPVDPDDMTPTWRRGGMGNDKNPVVYMYGFNPNLFAKFTVSPSQTTTLSALLRVKKDSQVVTTQNVPIQISGSEINIRNISLAYSSLETTTKIKRSEYEFTWEVSFDGGTNWKPAGKSKPHKIHWIYGEPIMPSFTDSVGRPFPSDASPALPKIYDVALDHATGELGNNGIAVIPNNLGLTQYNVAKRINGMLASDVAYKPNREPADNVNPLRYFKRDRRAVCWDNGLLFRGLLRTIGIDGTLQFHWGGDPRNNSPTRGRIHFYYDSGTHEEVNLQVTRRALTDGCSIPDGECVPSNPHFNYHVTVSALSTVFDPSYGLDDGLYDVQTGTTKNKVKVTDLITAADDTLRCQTGTSRANLWLVTSSTFFNRFNRIGPTRSCGSPSTFATNRVSFDSDSVADVSVFRPSTGEWRLRSSWDESEQIRNHLLLRSERDSIVPADYDGDKKLDVAVWLENGSWFIKNSGDDTERVEVFPPKQNGDVAVPRDYDGDGKADVAVWHGATGVWVIIRSSDGTTVSTQWGRDDLSDIPAPGDYDNDGKADLAVWRENEGNWYILSSNNSSWIIKSWGTVGDIPVPADYDGDGTTDFAVFRPSTGVWYFLDNNEDSNCRYYQGEILSANDMLVPEDYDGDGRVDVAFWKASTNTWKIVNSTDGTMRVEQWGDFSLGDKPVPSAYIYR